MRKYMPRKMFKRPFAYYVEVSDGDARTWLKDREVPETLRHLLLPRQREESAECASWALAQGLARAMGEDDAENRRNALVSSRKRDGKEITYGEWRRGAHAWRPGGRLIHSKNCFCGIPEPRINRAKVVP